MHKLFFIVLVLFTMSTRAQDTTYIQKRSDLYRRVRTHVTDSSSYKQYFSYRREQRRRNDRVFVGTVASVFLGLTVWFFYKQIWQIVWPRTILKTFRGCFCCCFQAIFFLSFLQKVVFLLVKFVLSIVIPLWRARYFQLQRYYYRKT